MKQIIKKIRLWWMHRQIKKACDASARRMEKMTKEERRELGDRARKIAYPNGTWECKNHLNRKYIVPKNQQCPECKRSEDAGKSSEIE